MIGYFKMETTTSHGGTLYKMRKVSIMQIIHNTLAIYVAFCQ